MFALFCLSQSRQSLNFNKVEVVIAHSITPFFPVRIHADLYTPVGSSSVQAL
jgi:hypothetical protein